jgi:exoribonuclease R
VARRHRPGAGEGRGSAELAAQLKLQDEAAGFLREARHRLGALTFDRLEAQPVFADGKVQDITARAANRAAHLIEDFMIAANEVMARTLRRCRRLFDTPRGESAGALAPHCGAGEQCGDTLPAAPDPGALNAFLVRRKAADPVHYADMSRFRC